MTVFFVGLRSGRGGIEDAGVREGPIVAPYCLLNCGTLPEGEEAGSPTVFGQRTTSEPPDFFTSAPR